MGNLAIWAWLEAAYQHDTTGSYGWERWTREQWWNSRPYLARWLRDPLYDLSLSDRWPRRWREVMQDIDKRSRLIDDVAEDAGLPFASIIFNPYNTNKPREDN